MDNLKINDELIKKARAEYMKAYRKRNPEAIKRANANYWTKIAMKSQEQKPEENMIKPDIS